ncbi:acetyl-CoA carboxylase biotin carboxyl carrier protein [Candidatus Viadribacter manganicus]|uniref:acetyl-CoA carboxylase biotin carboxyl carrier protein n=1 Tax=Candidatus Viadribacter manganicus TaxID=1759059 RepID=UPI001D17444B|nr:acetyl-CoA carboxylase biotin carboxyl carrier protein [Candidatus Viadribacter manganicus]
MSKKRSRAVVKKSPARVPQKRTPQRKPTHGVDAELVRDLAKVLDDSGLTEIEVEYGELRLRLARTLVMAPPPAHTHVVHSAPAPAAALPPPAAAAPPPAPVAAPPTPADAASHPGAVLSPMVGTAYLAANEDAPPFVRAGDKVTKGQTILLVEAMKTFNQIHAPRDGTVRQILVGNADPVEFNQPLMIIE